MKTNTAVQKRKSMFEEKTRPTYHKAKIRKEQLRLAQQRHRDSKCMERKEDTKRLKHSISLFLFLLSPLHHVYSILSTL